MTSWDSDAAAFFSRVDRELREMVPRMGRGVSIGSPETSGLRHSPVGPVFVPMAVHKTGPSGTVLLGLVSGGAEKIQGVTRLYLRVHNGTHERRFNTVVEALRWLCTTDNERANQKDG